MLPSKWLLNCKLESKTEMLYFRFFYVKLNLSYVISSNPKIKGGASIFLLYFIYICIVIIRYN